MEEVAGGSRPFASQTELTGTLAAEPSAKSSDQYHEIVQHFRAIEKALTMFM